MEGYNDACEWMVSLTTISKQWVPGRDPRHESDQTGRHRQQRQQEKEHRRQRVEDKEQRRRREEEEKQWRQRVEDREAGWDSHDLSYDGRK